MPANSMSVTNGISRRLLGAVFVAGLMTIPAPAVQAQALSHMAPDRYPIYQQTTSQVTGPDDETSDADVLPEQLRRQVVAYQGTEPAGTIIIDTGHTFLYLTLGSGKALRYGIGVGREGFTWSGVQTITRAAEWPDWVPPPEMVARQPYLPRWVAGGPGNPLGARALYLGNSEYRIHGTNDPTTIGKRVSSGCIRLQNADVTDLFARVGVGTKVIVLPNDQRRVAIEGGHGAPMTARIPVSSAADRTAPSGSAPRVSTADSGSTADGIY
jgi:lipoprotein-anchoring transpeptidase ErfK/SrfK